MNAAEQLRKAKADIETNGWFCGSSGMRWTNRNGATCAEVAIAHAAGGDSWHKARVAFQEAIGGGDIMIWNDAKERTLEEVYQAFDRAIEIAEGQP